MAHIGAGRPSQFPMDFGLERQQRENVIDIAAQLLGAAGPPSPNRRRYVLDDRNLRSDAMNAPRYSTGEGRAVDDDKGMRSPRDDLRGCEPDQAQYRRQTARYGTKADDRQVADRIKADQAFLAHLASANAGEAYLSVRALSQCAHERAAELVARFLGSDDEQIEGVGTQLGIAASGHACAGS